MKFKFNPGREVMTRGVADWIDSDVSDPPQLYWKILDCLKRHLSGDWGEVCEADRRENEFALRNGARLLSAYTVDDHKIWIITEADRSSTTILFPEEY